MNSTIYTKTYEVIWADMDPNRHMRHSVYNDYAAQTRVAIFGDFGMPLTKVADLGLGPILFKEESRFKKEIGLSERITVTCQLTAMQKDGSRWTFLHNIFKESGTEAAQIIVEGAWLNLKTRKLAAPPEELRDVVYRFPKDESFEWIESG